MMILRKCPRCQFRSTHELENVHRKLNLASPDPRSARASTSIELRDMNEIERLLTSIGKQIKQVNLFEHDLHSLSLSFELSINFHPRPAVKWAKSWAHYQLGKSRRARR